MLSLLSTLRDLLLVVTGFGLVIVVHELGHFLAARWAGVRVDQFAVGFGSAICSYRKGLGWRRGSSRREYESLPASRRADAGATEYRLNWFPLGGYVKMLGQDDLAATPAAIAAMPDSYLAAPVGKRMVIISAGVVMNLVLAAALFILVFMIGLRVESSVVGEVDPGSAAALAAPADGSAPGLLPGDHITRVNAKPIRSFNDLALAVAMAEKGAPLRLEVERDGRELALTAEPTVSDATGLLDLGVFPASSGQLLGPPDATPDSAARARRVFDEAGLLGVEPRSTLVSVNGQPAVFAHELERAVERAAGAPVRAAFRSPAPKGQQGSVTEVTLAALPRLQTQPIALSDDPAAPKWPVTHLLGIAAPMRVGHVVAQGEASGLKAGDIVARVGPIEWPDSASAIAEIRRSARKPIDITVLRDGAYVDLKPTVGSDGRLGFSAAAATSEPGAAGVRTAGPLARRHPSLLASAPARPSAPPDASRAEAAPASADAAALASAASLPLPPGSLILAVNDTPVSSFEALREALRVATADAARVGAGATVSLRIALPLESGPDPAPQETLAWTITPDAVTALHALGWRSPVDQSFFELARTTLKAGGPVGAVVMGVRETHRVLMTTYLTFRRLVEGSVKVEHLKGPVGIAHLGTMVASQGLLHLLFFLALISVNLAVVNFLPFPIVDGGQFVFLLVEAITRRPVSAAIQSAAIMVGVVLIGLMFVVVTFNDVSGLLR